MLTARIWRQMTLHRCMNTLPCHSNTLYRSVLCIIISLAFGLYSMIANKNKWINNFSLCLEQVLRRNTRISSETKHPVRTCTAVLCVISINWHKTDTRLQVRERNVSAIWQVHKWINFVRMQVIQKTVKRDDLR
jgi:hypothetical protein